jgi:hypothetical protein
MLLIDRFDLFDEKILLCTFYYYQIDLLQEPQHPVWKIILLKQCCGLNSKYGDYRWFEQTPFSDFCLGLHLKEDQIIKFKHTFKMKYSSLGPYLPSVNNELKMELILISIDFDFSVLLMLLTWLSIWQNRFSYLELLKNMVQKQKKNSIISTNKSSITSVTDPTVGSNIQEMSAFDKLDKSSQLDTTKPSETKRLYKGYFYALEDVG